MGYEDYEVLGYDSLECGRYISLIIYNIIFINYKWVDTRWQWLFYMYTECDIDYY
jgi:hypothetical protein